MNLENDIKNNPVKYGKLAVIIVVVIIIVIILINVGGGINNLFSGIKKAFGLASDPAADSARTQLNNETQSASGAQSPWGQYLNNNAPSNAIIISPQLAGQLAQQIYDSAGFWSVSASDGLAAIRQCPSQTDVSYLSYTFQTMFNRDLYNYMVTFYTSDDNVKIMQQIVAYVNSLPVVLTQ